MGGGSDGGKNGAEQSWADHHETSGGIRFGYRAHPDFGRCLHYSDTVAIEVLPLVYYFFTLYALAAARPPRYRSHFTKTVLKQDLRPFFFPE